MTPLLKRCFRLLTVLREQGEVVSPAGMVFGRNPYVLLMNNTEMYECVRHLATLGYNVERVDSGGLPTWRLK